MLQKYKTILRGKAIELYFINPYKPNGNFSSLSFERVHFEFKGCWVVNFNFIQILKVHFVRKQCIA